MITFTRAVPVESGAAVTSRERNLLARGVNSRLVSGLGDGVWRIVFYVLAAFRQIRNPDASFNLWPPQAEFFERFQAHAPVDGEYPVAGPGEGEGINVAGVIGAFVFGNESIDLGPEDERTADDCPLWAVWNREPSTPREFWEVGKLQRGAWDPTSGAVGCPAFTAAQQHFKIRHGRRSPHGNSYGGFMPIPEYLGDCADGTSDTLPTPSFKYFFTNLNDGSLREYPGSCPDTVGDVAFIASSPFAYYVYLWGGQVDVLPFADWLEGPYSGGDYLMKRPGHHMPRILNHFASGFRGTEEQRQEWMRYAFDTQAFMARQYLLAPARGVSAGDLLVPEYPQAVRRAAAGLIVPGGTALGWSNGEPRHATATGCVLASWFAEATKLVLPVKVELMDGNTVVDSVVLSPDEDGAAAEVRVLPLAAAWSNLWVRVAGVLKFSTASGLLAAEMAELYDYKPGVHDLYLALRLGSCLTNLSAMTDGDPTRETMSAEISAAYFDYGCLVNVRGYSGPPGSGSDINTNGVFETARQWSKVVRIVPRQNLLGYAVEGGKSVLWFRRAPAAWPGSGAADMFDGLGPSIEPIVNGTIRAGYRYVVREGSAIYNGGGYAVGQVFTGVAGQAEWTGGATVYEHDGIRSVAPPAGESNGWVMGAQFKAYTLSESSLFKPEAYADYFALSERCHFYHYYYGAELQNHLDYGQVLSFAPEAPAGYRYVNNKNVIICTEGDTACEALRLNTYRSCRIYEPDPEIESAVRDVFNGAETLKITLTTRLHHCPTAPGSVARDITTWSDDPATEPFRSTENGIREYLLHVRNGSHCAKAAVQPGNASVNSQVSILPDDPWGTCYPHFYFVKLVPEVYEDGNDTQQSTDSPFTHDAMQQTELYLRCMCEGFVDGATNRERGCASASLSAWDYTYENLCYDAFGGRWVNTLATEATELLGEDDVRPDNPEGFGPLPNTLASAEVFNQLVSMVNLLTTVRVLLPWTMECRGNSGVATKVTYPVFPSPPEACNSANKHSWTHDLPPDAPASTVGAWGECAATPGSTCSSTMNGTCDGSYNWLLVTYRDDVDYRFSLPPAALEAVPEAFRDMVGDLATYGRILAVTTTTTSVTRARLDPTGDNDGCWTVGLFTCWFDAGAAGCWVFDDVTTVGESCGFVAAAGTLHAAPPTVGDFAFGRQGDEQCYTSQFNRVQITPVINESILVEVPLS